MHPPLFILNRTSKTLSPSLSGWRTSQHPPRLISTWCDHKEKAHVSFGSDHHGRSITRERLTSLIGVQSTNYTPQHEMWVCLPVLCDTSSLFHSFKSEWTAPEVHPRQTKFSILSNTRISVHCRKSPFSLSDLSLLSFHVILLCVY